MKINSTAKNIKYWIVGSLIAASVTTTVVINKDVDRYSNKLQLLVIHTSATPEGRNVTAERIYKMHTNPKSKGGFGWQKPGYRDVIELDGEIVNLIKYNNDGIVQVSEITNGVRGYNRIAAHVCYIGGLDSITRKPKNTLTAQQDSALKAYVFTVIGYHPDIYIAGHNQFANKACPCFDVPAKLKQWGVPNKNIFMLKIDTVFPKNIFNEDI